ncbi:RNA-directed DNA polymerase from mobile element jockey-like [Elysia marginata]|uniref:RNA-directed DNA polymerase from mobile element jockey-like n=1 Tax=Elysia marginata TaxID=1093978 RepID=A0AAV4JWG0_9GAST|nr:RNA-directed DNA polymerase from mobile element jockey-like [Elysia marginata]
MAPRDSIGHGYLRLCRGIAHTALQRLSSVHALRQKCYDSAATEYCAPVWTRSPNTKLVDVKLSESKGTKGGCLKSRPIQWLPTISSIAPPHFRREDSTQKMIKRIEDMADNIPLQQIYKEAPTRRLRSRNGFYKD